MEALRRSLSGLLGLLRRWGLLPEAEIHYIGGSDTLPPPLSREREMELVGRLEHTNFRGNTLTLKIKFHDFSQITRSMTQTKELVALDVILPLAKQLLQEVDYEHHPIRLIGLSVSNPREEGEEKGVWEQLSFEFSDWETEHSNK